MFQRTFPSVSIFADSTIKRIIDQFRDLKRSDRPHALTDEERTELCEKIEEEPGIPIRRVNQYFEF